ncbi:hypothetical protein M569_03652, partial [Genlisea aurea]
FQMLVIPGFFTCRIIKSMSLLQPKRILPNFKFCNPGCLLEISMCNQLLFNRLLNSKLEIEHGFRVAPQV